MRQLLTVRPLIRQAPTLTRRGWAMGVGAVVLAASGRILGVFELFVLATACAGLVVAGVVAVVWRPVHLEAVRFLRPPRVHAGDDARVELVLRNRGRRTTPVVAIRDSYQGGPSSSGAPRSRGRARFLVAPLRPGREERASYRLTAERRGRYTLGPLQVDRGDAFGLVSSVRNIAPTTNLTVFPRVDAIAPLPSSPGSIASGTYLPTAVGSSGEEFYGLREYQVGDDMRRVHWPSTARLGELVVRQLELPWEGRATVTLDTRASCHHDQSIEVAVSAAASIILAFWRGGSSVRLVSTDGFDSGPAKGHGHLEAILEYLAVASPAPARDGDTVAAPGGVGAPPRRGGRAGGVPARGRGIAPARGENTVVVTTSAATFDDLAAIAGPRRHQERLTLVVVDGPGPERPVRAGSTGPERPVRAAEGSAGATVVRVSASVPLPEAWSRAMAGPAGSRTAGGWGTAGRR